VNRRVLVCRVGPTVSGEAQGHRSRRHASRGHQRSRYGRLSSEPFRAVRLEVDTGIRAKGWSRAQVVEFMRNSDAIDEPTIKSETERYISSPAQALSYKLGQLKIRELLNRAQKELGPRFDIRTFHDEILNGGTLPLDLLDARINRRIAEQNAQR
jgi:uncharacterized protein (DUF885 family)